MTSNRGPYKRVPQNSGLASNFIKVVKKMDRERALKVLGLQGPYPSPKEVKNQFDSLFERYSEAHRGNPRKYAEINMANSVFKEEHKERVRLLGEAFKKNQAAYATELDTIKTSHPDIFKKYNLITLGEGYIAELKKDGVDTKVATDNYYNSYNKYIDHYTTLPVATSGSLVNAAHKCFADISKIPQPEPTNTLSLDSFQDQYATYVSDIEALKVEATKDSHHSHHKEDFDWAIDQANTIGKNYFSGIAGAKTTEDQLKVADTFRSEFKHMVAEAKEKFSKEPGIWRNLSACYKLMAILCLCIPAIIILYMEKPEDRQRLFFGAPKDELNLEKAWEQWDLDIFPEPVVQTAPKTK